MKTMEFHSYDEYEAWTEQFDEAYEYQNIPSLIDDGWKIMMDMFTECKSYKTALRRFEKAFGDHDQSVKDWLEGIKESCENGYFKDTCRPGWNATEEEIKEFYAGGTFSWGVEEVDDGYWYIFLNISGAYAGRDERVAC